MKTRVGLLAGAVIAAACSAPMVMMDADAGTPDAGTPDAGAPFVDAGPDCTDPSSTADAGLCGVLAYWMTSPTMTRPRNHHISAMLALDAGTFLFVAGGYSGSTSLNQVDRATVNGDSTLSEFDSQPTLPSPVGGLTGGFMGGLFIVAGGTGETSVFDTSAAATVYDNGTLSAFVPAGSIGHPRMHAASVDRNGWMYIMGGFRDPDVWSDIVKATVDGGTLTPWEPGGTLPGPLSHMAATRVGDYVYLTGGLNVSADADPPVLKSVSRGHFDATTGDLGEWVALPDLPGPVCCHATAFYGGYLYLAGGISNTAELAQVLRAQVLPDATLGPWTQTVPLPVPRGHVHNLPFFENHMYSIAGAVDFSLKATGDIQIGTFQ